MPVNSDQLAAFRTLLRGETEENERIQQKLDQADGWEGYGALVAAGFFIAVERWFADSNDSDIIEYVAFARARSDIGDKVDPVAAERLIKAVHGDESIDDLESEARIGTQVFLLVALIYDANLDDAGLETFIDEVRPMADQWVDAAP